MYTTQLLLKGLDFGTLEYYSKHFNIEVHGLIDYYTLRLNIIKNKEIVAVRDIDLFDLVEFGYSESEAHEKIWSRAQAIKTEFIFDYQNLLHAA